MSSSAHTRAFAETTPKMADRVGWHIPRSKASLQVSMSQTCLCLCHLRHQRAMALGTWLAEEEEGANKKNRERVSDSND